jgi:hypothetical protein
MFDRSACAGVRVGADAHANMAALMALAELVRHALNDRFAPSNAPLSGATRLSRDQNRGEVHATGDEADVGGTPRTAADRSVRGRTADDDRRHAGVVRVADGDPISADRPDDTVDLGACRQEPNGLGGGGRS